MIITRTPLRISFFGGGTDYPAYFRQHGGATLATTIDKYTYVTVSPLTDFFEHRIGVYYSKVERHAQLDQIEHPSVRECLRHMGVDNGVEIHIAADLPARSGLGSSSCFTVGLLRALFARRGQLISNRRLALVAMHVEQELIRERVGCQDQLACAVGGLNLLRFSCEGEMTAEPVVLSRERRQELEANLMLFYTGMQRTAHVIIQEQLERTSAGQLDRELGELGELVFAGLEMLNSANDLDSFGKLLHRGWMLKRKCSSKTSNARIDGWYEAARQAGAEGGKLLGAGGGGFLLLFARPDRQTAVRQALRELKQVPFAFESSGSSVIFVHP